MQLENSFTVPVPIDEAWRVLLDIERIAPCMPGAALDSVTGDDFTGRVKVKLGPINLTYQGKASFVEKDEAAHKAVIDARGKDQRGNGTAAAVITANLKPEGDVTRVDVLTDLNITGRPAQFGRGVMTDVGNKLLGQFADKLAAQLGEGAPAPAPSTAEKVAATATGAVEEVAASAEQVPGDGAAAQATKKAAAATKKAAAAATDSTTERVTATSTVPAKTAPAAAGEAPATPAAAAPSAPSVPAAEATTPTTTPSAPRPVSEPEPIDLLEVAGGAAVARYAKPAAGVGLLLLLIFLIARRRRG
ncbi:SRPBCC family protein [Geodermatophilus sp. URMC 64]